MKTKTKQEIKETMFRMIMLLLCIIGLISSIDTINYFIDPQSHEFYKHGFQDGQANVTQITCEGEYYAITTNWQYTDLITGNISYSNNYTKIGCVRK